MDTPPKIEAHMVFLGKLPVSPTLNRWQRMHWAVRRKQGRVWQAAVIALGIPRVIKPCLRLVKFVRVGSRLVDTDGLYGGLKPVVDALKSVKAIWDDDPDHLSLYAEQRKRAKKEIPHMVIEVWE